MSLEESSSINAPSSDGLYYLQLQHGRHLRWTLSASRHGQGKLPCRCYQAAQHSSRPALVEACPPRWRLHAASNRPPAIKSSSN